ncbi:hypothetical protein CRG98_015577 [Punica granatum]|uniref:Uncharacterized protein n=1 Tax=Punica granatum TaxID=22663 RepID=A0A2I0K684_PUNGR|nr:hypothetical protein CRG98_015577 [Punica granatum]
MATSGRTATREAPVYVAYRGCVGANFNRGCPSVRRLLKLCWRELQPEMPQWMSLGNAYRGWMMSEVVSVQALNANAPVFIVDVTRAVLGKARGAGSHENSSSCRGGRVKAASSLPAKVGTTRLSCGVGGRDGLGFWSQHISLWISEDRGWSTREGWHDSPVVRGGWPGWTASGHSTSRHGEVKTTSGLPAKSRQAVRTRMWTLVGAHMRAFGSRGLGVSTFPWGRVTDTRERRSRHLSFYDPKVEGG